MQRLIWIKPPGTVLAQYLNQWGSKSQTLDYWNYLNTTILCLLFEWYYHDNRFFTYNLHSCLFELVI